MSTIPHTRGRLQSVAALLLLGAAMNVLVAWGCALWLPVVKSSVRSHVDVESSGAPGWAVDRLRLDRLPASWTRRPKEPSTDRLAFVQTSEGLGVRHIGIDLHETFRRPYEQSRHASVGYVLVIEAGLPFPALQALHEGFDPKLLAVPVRDRDVTAASNDASGQPTRWRGAINLPAGIGTQPLVTQPGATPWFLLPYGIRPLGFSLNTLFWAAALGVPALAWSRVRRARRSGRGLCLGCGYDLKSLPTCPECGTAAAGWRAAAP